MQRLFVKCDHHGRVIVGEFAFIEEFICPRDPRGQAGSRVVDWDGSWYKEESAIEEIGHPIAIAVIATLGYFGLIVFLATATVASLIDKITGRTQFRKTVDSFLNEKDFTRSRN